MSECSPDELRLVAQQLYAVAEDTLLLHDRLRSHAESLSGSWAGAARDAFERVVVRALRGLLVLAEAHRRAADALHGYSGHLPAAVARRELHDSADDIRHDALHEFVDMLGAPGLGFEALGLGTTAYAATNVARTAQALESGDFAELMTLDSEAYAPVTEAVSTYGPDSLEALDAWLGWQSGSFDRALGELGHAVDGMGEIPSSGFAEALDVVGKAGLVTGAVGDALTIADGSSSEVDRGMSGANLAGLGMAGLGTETGASAAAFVGIDAVAGWVPVAGQVVVGATALYLAGDWAYQHWDGIKSAAGSAVHAVEDVASDAVDAAEHVASDLNPMNW